LDGNKIAQTKSIGKSSNQQISNGLGFKNAPVGGIFVLGKQD
jgi:hypothetical protein